MINAVYYDKRLIFIRATFREKLVRLPSSGSEYELLNTFEFIKPVIRHDKWLLWQAFDIYWGYTFEFIKAVSGIVVAMSNAAYYDKPLIFIEATFQEKLAYYYLTIIVNIYIAEYV